MSVISSCRWPSSFICLPHEYGTMHLQLSRPSSRFATESWDFVGLKLDEYWTVDASVTWETPDRRLVLGLTVLNLFDNEYEVLAKLPGQGRTVAASVKARF